MATWWVLVVIALGGSDGGKAIDTSLRFITENRCLAAEVQVRAAVRPYYSSNALITQCLSVDGSR
jgi:hypothetical protein